MLQSSSNGRQLVKEHCISRLCSWKFWILQLHQRIRMQSLIQIWIELWGKT